MCGFANSEIAFDRSDTERGRPRLWMLTRSPLEKRMTAPSIISAFHGHGRGGVESSRSKSWVRRSRRLTPVVPLASRLKPADGFVRSRPPVEAAAGGLAPRTVTEARETFARTSWHEYYVSPAPVRELPPEEDEYEARGFARRSSTGMKAGSQNSLTSTGVSCERDGRASRSITRRPCAAIRLRRSRSGFWDCRRHGRLPKASRGGKLL